MRERVSGPQPWFRILGPAAVLRRGDRGGHVRTAAAIRGRGRLRSPTRRRPPPRRKAAQRAADESGAGVGMTVAAAIAGALVAALLMLPLAWKWQLGLRRAILGLSVIVIL